MRTVSLLLLIGVWTLGGCAKPADPPKPTPPSNQPVASVTPAANPTPPPATTAPTTAPAADLPPVKNQNKQWPRPERKSVDTVLVDANTPEAVVEQLSKAISEEKYQALWEALPDTHQADLRTIVKEFVDHMDPPLYDQVVSIVELMTKSMEKHKDRFFALAVSSEMPVPKEKLQKAWDPIVGLGKALLDSELYDLTELKQVDMPAFMAATLPRVVAAAPALVEIGVIPADGGNLYFGFVDALKSVKASRVSGDEQKAVVKIEAEGRDPVDVEFVKVAGKWIPSQLEKEWPNVLKQLRDVIALAPDKSDQNAIQNAYGTLIFVAITAAQLNKADNDEALDKMVRALIKFMPKSGDSKPEDAKPGDAKSTDANSGDAKPATPESTDKPKP